jgi:hypothetical protein
MLHALVMSKHAMHVYGKATYTLMQSYLLWLCDSPQTKVQQVLLEQIEGMAGHKQLWFDQL